MSRQEADDARYEIDQYYNDGLINYREHRDCLEAIENATD